MARPRFAPGSAARFRVKNRPGAPRDAARYLATRLAAPAEWVAPLLAAGRVTIDGAPAAPGAVIDLARAREIAVRLPEAWPPHLAPVAMELDILHEDEHLLILNKPPGVIVHPARGHMDNDSLQNGVRHRYRAAIGQPGVTLGSPHRLDMDTSGVVVFARRTDAYRDLARQFAAGLVHKAYLLIADAAADFPVATVDTPLGPRRDRPGEAAALPPHEGGKAASTDFHPLERGPDWTLLRAVPRTGRLHQIRVHAAGLGLPLVGDRVYNRHPGDADRRAGLKRQALHAESLEITHPATGRQLRLAAPPPADMLAALERLRHTKNGGIDL